MTSTTHRLIDTSTIEQTPHGVYYTLPGISSMGGKVQVAASISKCACTGSSHDKHCLSYMWYKRGSTETILKTWWHIAVYAYEDDGVTCWGRFNPTVKPATDYTGQVLDFDWVLEATEDNLELILQEVARLAELQPSADLATDTQ